MGNLMLKDPKELKKSGIESVPLPDGVNANTAAKLDDGGLKERKQEIARIIHDSVQKLIQGGDKGVNLPLQPLAAEVAGGFRTQFAAYYSPENEGQAHESGIDFSTLSNSQLLTIGALLYLASKGKVLERQGQGDILAQMGGIDVEKFHEFIQDLTPEKLGEIMVMPGFPSLLKNFFKLDEKAPIDLHEFATKLNIAIDRLKQIEKEIYLSHLNSETGKMRAYGYFISEYVRKMQEKEKERASNESKSD